MRFKNHNVVITGGNSGIGKAAAKRFIEEGAQVAIMGRNPHTLNETVEELGSSCKSYCIDLSDVQKIKEGLNPLIQAFPKIDTLFLNAGVTKRLSIGETQESDFDTLFNTNVKGPFFTFQTLLPYLSQEASIISTSSVSALMGIKHSGLYAASKSALNRLMIAFAAECTENKKMRFNTISPGVTKTPIFEPRIEKDPDYLDKIAATVPMKRLGDPNEIASAVLFLASDESKYICGANLVIDGAISSIYPWQELQESLYRP